MKIPLGLLLTNPRLAKDKVLISPLEIKPHLKISAGTVLTEKAEGEGQTPLDRVVQVFDKLKERVARSKDPSLFHKATENMDKQKTVYFNNEHELVDVNVLCVNVANADDLNFPDGELFRILMTLYPRAYPFPRGKIRLSELSALVELRSVQILNDLSLPYMDSLLVEYGEVLNRSAYIGLREKLNKMIRPMKKEDLLDQTTGGEFLVRRDLFSYTKKFLFKENTRVGDSMMSSPYITCFLEGDPEILYRFPESRQGIYLAENDMGFTGPLKKFLKQNFHKLMGETLNKKELLSSIGEFRPQMIFLGCTGTDEQVDPELAAEVIQTGSQGGMNEQDMGLIVFMRGKDADIEAKLRSAGVTFIFDQKESVSNPNGFFGRLASTLDLLQESV